MHYREENLIRILAASLTPTTLAAVINDLSEHDQLTEEAQDKADAIANNLYRQLVAMIGESDATANVGENFHYAVRKA